MTTVDNDSPLLRTALLYSGTWRFCKFAARVVARLDRREDLALLPLADPEGARLLGNVPASARGECWWLVCRDGSLLPGDAGGGVALLAEIRLTQPAARVLRAVHASGLVDALDKLVAQHRARLGRFVPDGTAPRRYPWRTSERVTS